MFNYFLSFFLSPFKVAPGSLAEQAGLQLGDCVVKISNQNADQMLHHEAQDAIKMAKNNLDMQVQRYELIFK